MLTTRLSEKRLCGNSDYCVSAQPFEQIYNLV
nr:MAG TPA: Interferon alpha/beta receptor [Caudoviricetes sp.]